MLYFIIASLERRGNILHLGTRPANAADQKKEISSPFLPSAGTRAAVCLFHLLSRFAAVGAPLRIAEAFFFVEKLLPFVEHEVLIAILAAYRFIRHNFLRWHCYPYIVACYKKINQDTSKMFLPA
jgi:hypothetical protein